MCALAALLATSCVKDTTAEGSDAKAQLTANKFVNTIEDATAGKLILYLDEATAEQWAAGDVTRSGNTQLDAVVASLGAESISQVFNMSINAELKMAKGLHRWFVVNFDETTDLQGAAEKFASMGEVQRVQFSTEIKRPKVKCVPVTAVEATRAADVPFNDPQLPLQWHYINNGNQKVFYAAKVGEDIGAYGAWKYTTGNNQVVVAVVDEGVKYDHEDLADNMWVNEAELNGVAGQDDDGNGYVDDVHGLNAVRMNGEISWAECSLDKDGMTIGDTGHGTHVAGTIAAVNNNGIGVSGVAGGDGSGNGVRIMSIQIFDGMSKSSIDKNAKGIEYAADNGASILQNSWGYSSAIVGDLGDGDYERLYGVEHAAIEYFVSKSNCAAMTGGVAIFAAGNDAQPRADFPGAYNKYLAVTAYSPDGLPTTYTNYGLGCNVSAPGGDQSVVDNKWEDAGGVLSTIPAETLDPYTGKLYGASYGYMQGTSMACPHVSGVAALVLSYALDNGIQLTNNELYEILTTSVRNIDDMLDGTKTYFNYSNGSPFQVPLAPFKGKMGTGKLDATLAIMNVRGATCVPVVTGQEFMLEVGKLLGDTGLNVTVVRDFVIEDDVRERLGITSAEFFNNNIYITCTKPGIGVITVNFVAGGEAVGGGSTVGGKLIEKEIVLVSRQTNDNGGWM